MRDQRSLDLLARLYGIEAYFDDAYGRRRRLSDTTKRDLLDAMGVRADTARAQQTSIQVAMRAHWRHGLKPVVIVLPNAAPLRIPINLPGRGSHDQVAWRLVEENGVAHEGVTHLDRLPISDRREFHGHRVERRTLILPVTPPEGYHRLSVAISATTGATSRGTVESGGVVIVAPKLCYAPAGLGEREGVWGFAIQLYALASRTGWGMGDLGDLAPFVEDARALGADAIGLNPLHLLSVGSRMSPYAPSSRLALEPLYINVEAVPEFRESPRARTRVARPEFQRELQALRAATLVDYAAIAALKRSALEDLFDTFCSVHLERGSDRATAYRRFCEEQPLLERLATFETLRERTDAERGRPTPWQEWPAAYRVADSAAVAQFAREHAHRVEFFKYLQFEADRQVAAAAGHATQCGMSTGLYRDLALGADASGADSWMYRHSLASQVAIGAPPDVFNPQGQNWGFPPFTPGRLREAAYGPFIAALRHSMRYAGALRIDHILGLARLYWIPHGAHAADGGYVRYPLDALLAITALESHRHRCMVVGEDLGTVPGGLRTRLQAAGILSSRVLYFERSGGGAFRPPEAYPPLAQVSVGTHDLPTLHEFWTGSDIELRARLHLIPSSPAELDVARAERAQARAALLAALEAAGLWQAGRTPSAAELVEAVYAFLGRTPSWLLMVQLEDVLGILDQVNLPGTTDEYPNWRRKLPIAHEALAADRRVRAVAQILAGRAVGVSLQSR